MSTASNARADSACELRWESASVPDAWTDALRDVRVLVGKLTRETTDCRSITVSPDGLGATVVFTTADGRTARRRIADPAELRPMVEALLVFQPDPPRPPVDAGPPAVAEETPATPPAPTALAPALATGEAADAPRRVTTAGPSMLLGAGAGVKGSFPRDMLAAVGQVFVGMSLEHWELAAFGRWELEHDARVAPDASARHLKYSALGGGAMLGRRETVGPLIFVAGTRAAAFAAEEERSGHHDDGAASKPPRAEEKFLDPRLGLYAGCIVSESSRVRFRIQVDADAGLVEHRAQLAELPNFPRWNLGISLGAETGLFR
jgi:hypothetical protein